MKKVLLLIYLLSLAQVVYNYCNCCDQCGQQQEQQQGQQQQEYQQPTGSCPEIRFINGGLSGSGFASRYWDCCKPSCSWSSNAGYGNEARHCDANMNILTDNNAASKCDGGPSTTCLSQIPFTINGCDNIGFAFGAVPGAGPNICGRCFLLEFTGEGKYETKDNHRALKNKKLVVMASNIGYDVAGGQFDIMIPGGGVGLFNGCGNIFSGNMGQQYGGLLSDCENEVGWSGSDYEIHIRRKECLKKKCENTFNGNTLAKEGCLFLANFMEAAGNPLHSYKEIECPQILKDKY